MRPVVFPGGRRHRGRAVCVYQSQQGRDRSLKGLATWTGSRIPARQAASLAQKSGLVYRGTESDRAGAADVRLRTVGADSDRRQEVAARALLTWSKCDQCGRIASGGRPQVAGLIEVNPSHTKAGWKP